MGGENTKNYREQGGDRWVVGGELDVTGTLKFSGTEFAPAAAQSDSAAVDTAGIVADFNALLAKLRAAGIIET